MPVKSFRPITPSRRQMIVADFSVLTRKKPEKGLLGPRKQMAGRSGGKISVRHRGGGAKRRMRIVDFGQGKLGVPGKIVSLEYDPNRTAYIMLVHYKDGYKRYVLAPEKVKIGGDLLCANKAPIKAGNRIKLANIPNGIPIYNIELSIGRGGQIVRGAGNSSTIMAKEGDWVTIKLPSTPAVIPISLPVMLIWLLQLLLMPTPSPWVFTSLMSMVYCRVTRLSVLRLSPPIPKPFICWSLAPKQVMLFWYQATMYGNFLSLVVPC